MCGCGVGVIKLSSVFVRNRNETELVFLVNGQKLQVELTKYIMKEKYLPKKWRYILGQNIISKVDELMDNIIAANSIYPTTEKELEMRKNFQTLAITNCYQLQSKILRIEKCIDTVKMEDLSEIIELLNKETTTLKSWKKSSKLIK